MRRFCFLIFCLLILACSSAPEGKPGGVVAGIFIYRSEAAAPKVAMKVAVDGKQIGETSPATCFYIEVPPGMHRIESVAENTATLEIEVMAGKKYYVWQEVRLGILSARTKLTLMTDEEGRRGVSECQPAVVR